jgi:hypothetical protein
MFAWNDRVPGYLLGKVEITSTVVFTALFSVVLLLISVPFSHNVWFELAGSEAFGFTVLFFFIALLVVCLSKRLLYGLGKSGAVITNLHYVLWNIGEIALVCLLYTMFTVEGDRFGILDLKDQTFEEIFFSSLVYCFMSMAVPYTLSAMYFALNDRDNTIRLMNYGSVVTDEVLQPREEKKITLFDNSGVLKLSLNLSSLLYIESDDNYIKVWYIDSHSTLKQYMLRCRLKTVEESFAGSPLIRCHRKYIVNMDRVVTLKKEKDGYEVELDNETIDPIPITKTYEEHVLAYFNSSDRNII